MTFLTSFPRFHRAVFVMAVVAVLTTVTSVIFVAADNSRSTPAPESSTATETPTETAVKARIAERFGRLPLSFEHNEGQVDPAVEFLSHGPGYDLFLTANEAVLSLRKPVELKSDQFNDPQLNEGVREGSVLRLKMIGANPVPHVEGRDELPGKVNYFTGNDPQKWRRNVPTFRKVYYKDVYPGIDVVYYGNQRELEYDFIVAPGANPKVIKFHVAGANRISLDQAGNLLLALEHGEVRLNKPFIYQLSENGGRNEVKGAYAIKGREISFKVRGFDARKPLVIDPVLSYSTYLGSGGDDSARSIAVDSQGSAYVTGNSSASTFPTTAGAFKTTSATGGAFVTKLDPTGSSLVYSTYLTGTTASGSTFGQGIAVDAAGNAYVTGVTQSSDFPVVNSLKTSGNFSKTTDGAASWNNNNTGLPGDIRAIATAPNAPQTLYAGTPTGPYRSTDGGVTWTKLPTNGAPVFPSPISMAVSPTNSAVVYAGFTNGGLFRTVDGGNTWGVLTLPSLGATVFSIVFHPTTASTLYVATSSGVFRSSDSGSTWTPLNNFGTQFPPNVRALAIDPTTPATIYAGTSGSGLFKTTNGGTNWSPINNGLSGSEATFVNTIVIDPSNTSIVYAGHGAPNFAGLISKTTNGGSLWSPINNGVPAVPAHVLVIDRNTPSTLYAGMATLGVYKTTNAGGQWTEANTGLWNGNVTALVAHVSNPATLFAGASGTHPSDAFVTKLNPSGSGLLFSTYLGGNSLESGLGIAVDATGNIYVVGQTMSRNFPTANALQATQRTNENCTDGFVTKINPSAPSYVFSTYLGGSSCDTTFAVALDSAAAIYVAGHTTSSNFPTANAFQPSIAETFSGDSFVTKLTTSGSLVYSTYLGGNNNDTARGIAVDSSGRAYVTGSTSSSNFPTLNQIPGLKGFADDAFVTKLNGDGSALVYSTYVGGDSTDVARGIAVDATGAAHVTGFTGSLHFPITAGALRTESVYFKSTDGGAKWTNDNYGLILGVNATINALAVHPTQPSTVYAGTGSGVFKSINGGRTWLAINNGLNDTRVSMLLLDPQNPSIIYVVTENFGSANHGVYKSTDGGSSWNLRKNGMGSVQVGSLAIDPVTPNILYAAAREPFGQSKNFKTTDGADNWTEIGNAALSLSSLAVDPHNHTTIYAAGGSSNNALFRSIDSGATWQSIGFNQTGPFGFFIVASPNTPGLLYAVVGLGLFKSVDSGNNWTQVAERFGKIVLDPVNPNTLYSISTQEGLLKSTNGGQTWTSLNNGLNQPIALALAIDPLNPSTLHFAGRHMSGDDAFVFKVNPSGSALVYSTLLGGTAAQDSSGFSAQAFGIALDNAGNAYVAGATAAPNFQTTPNSFQPLLRFFTDAFVTKLTMSHIISGRVLDGSNAPVSGAEVILSDGTSITQYVTESDGSYEFSRLREGRNYTVRASKPHFTMAPASQTFNNLNGNQTLDFTATATNAAFHTIGGKITINGAGLAGVTVTLSGSQSGLRTTDSNGNYSFELPAGGNYTVTPALLGFTFGPINGTFNNLSASQVSNFTATRQNFVVTNNNNHGTGSLRDAIVNANATVGTDTITFNIPGTGVKTIALMNELPEITDPVVIDATTQPGYAGSPLIEIDGSALLGTTNGFVITAGGSTIRGLAIGGFRNSAAIFIRNCDNNVIQSNRIGVDAAGNTARPNSTGIALSVSSNNLIGGATAAARNIISGNTNIGIELAGGAVDEAGSNNVVQGNYIGTNAAGTAAIANGNYGVSSFIPGATNNQIGGTSPGSANLISGNELAGVRINGSGQIVQGNLIGTDITGTKSIPNGTGIVAGATNAQIGGLTAAARNIISGNNGDGVFMNGAGSKLQGNYIGTDITGTKALGNDAAGVVAGNNVLIGGTTPEARNVIAANASNGNFRGNVALGLDSSGSGVTVQGNYIGTDVTGTVALGTSTAKGITLFTQDHVIGGLVAGARNVISGHITGIQILGSNGNLIRGNFIGLNAAGTGAIPNSALGIFVANGNNNTIGGTQSGAANKIAFNGGPGIQIAGGANNTIRGNSIFANTGLGIDLGTVGDTPTGVTPNDPIDADIGANNLQNFPVISTVSSNASSTRILGSLNSIPNTTFQVDFYSNAAVDPSGNGEGALFFNTTSVTTNGSGNAVIDVTFPIALPSGRVITATATEPNGNTSEFSAADPTGAAGSVHFSFNSFFVIEDVGMAVVTVQRTGGSLGNLSVQYETANGTAIAGQDYTAASGTLNFANGEMSKTIQVPITNDTTTEPDETFTLALKSPANLDSLGSPINMTITIQDRTTVPALLVFNASVTEGDSGTTTEARLEVRLSAATGRTVTINYATANGNAHGGAACGTQGVDFESRSGSLTFQPRTFQHFVPVKVCGDRSAELNEGFLFGISTPVNATIAHGTGFGTILNDDVIELVLEESSPIVNQAAAVDSIFLQRDPFHVVSILELLAPGSDRNTRVMLFVKNLELNPGENSSAVVVRLIGSNNAVFEVSAEDFRSVPNTDLMQVVFRLPNDLPPGTCTIFIRSHGRISNLGTIRIAP